MRPWYKGSQHDAAGYRGARFRVVLLEGWQLILSLITIIYYRFEVLGLYTKNEYFIKYDFNKFRDILNTFLDSKVSCIFKINVNFDFNIIRETIRRWARSSDKYKENYTRRKKLFWIPYIYYYFHKLTDLFWRI